MTGLTPDNVVIDNEVVGGEWAYPVKLSRQPAQRAATGARGRAPGWPPALARIPLAGRETDLDQGLDATPEAGWSSWQRCHPGHRAAAGPGHPRGQVGRRVHRAEHVHRPCVQVLLPQCPEMVTRLARQRTRLDESIAGLERSRHLVDSLLAQAGR